MSQTTSILLVDDHRLSRKSLTYLLEGTNQYRVIGEAGTGREAVRWLEANTVDLVITDVAMPEMDGVSLLRVIRSQIPDQKVLAMTVIKNTIPIKEMLELGVNGYFLKNSEESEILKALSRVSQGKYYLPMNLTNQIMDDLTSEKNFKESTRGSTKRFELFSKRERETLKLLSRHSYLEEIGDQLAMNKQAVETLIKQLMIKTNSADLSELIAHAKNHTK